MNKNNILSRTMFMSLVGSRAFGTHTEESDADYKGIFIAEPKYYLGFSTIEQTNNFEGSTFYYGIEDDMCSFAGVSLSRDTEIYELKRFFNLAMQNNPSILDVVFAPVQYVNVVYENVVDLLLENRDAFLSKKCKFSFSGYAVQQLHKIEMHRKWLLDPPTAPPDPLDYGITDIELVDKSQTYSFYEYLFELMNLRIDYCEGSELLTKEFVHLLKESVDYKQLLRTQQIPDGLLEYTAEFAKTTKEYVKVMQQIKAYIKSEEHWNNYQTWKKNRNANRAGMEQKIGYDTKHAMHCLRLLRMGCEILEGKGVIVDRRQAGDVEQLREVRFGNIKYNTLMEWVATEKERMEKAHQITTLPKEPNRESLDNVCVSIVERFI